MVGGIARAPRFGIPTLAIAGDVNASGRALDGGPSRKRMPNRKRGGQPGNGNAIKHGRFSASVRAARLAAWEEQQRRSDEWMKRIPETDYGAIVDNLRALKQRKEAARQTDDLKPATLSNVR